MKNSTFILPIVAALLVTACGGGSSGGSDNTVSTNTPTNAGGVLSGRFVDSAVAGLQYETASQSGLTGADGSFNYRAGESITFSIGDISLPTVPAANIMTPLNVFSTNEIADPRVINFATLLQTLDTDGDPENGIVLSGAASANAAGLNVDFSSAQFEDQVVNLVANSGSVNTSLVNSIEALDHLQETLFVEGINERPTIAATPEPQAPTNAQNTSSHPLVGRSAEFSNFAHGIAGTMTVLDDRTIQVTNFNYDAGGVSVFFYTGLDGDFFSGQAIGPQLNGRSTPYVNETITLTIPDNLTLDDFNGLSVWCIPFAVSFGDATL